MKIAIKSPRIYPRPFDAPRAEPEGRCCVALSDNEAVGAIVFDRGRGCFTIVNPAQVAVVCLTGAVTFPGRLMISFCPYCGFQWNTIAEQNVILTPRPQEKPQS
ncbi:MAG TPA: hypothetical protein VN915_06840 [Elusimicrobiota bacterium]|nr:hypothetical protein [Elusimicrobiota bacterium]